MAAKKKTKKETDKKKTKKPEDIKEIFKINEKGKPVTFEKTGELEEKIFVKDEKEQVKNENAILKWILIFFGVFILLVIAYFAYAKLSANYNYRGVSFEITQEGELLLHKTSIPVIYQGEERDYNFYLRNDPRKLKVDFNGDLILKNNAVLNMSKDFNCDGYGMIAIANFAQLFQTSGINLIQDPNATCSETGQYMFIRIEESADGKTKIEQTGESCYNIYINNCEILEGTERFMIEMFVELNKMIKEE